MTLNADMQSGAPSRITLLSPNVAEKIAAGEVVERPASAVKELLENAIDAGATSIAVVLEDGGKSLIEVLDNGSGIHADDLALATERHATSKIREFDDLSRLSTLGFRGEALPSLAAVAELQILSRAAPATLDSPAYELSLDPTGTSLARHVATTFGLFQGSAHGTRVRVRNLFAQVPARLKFLKSSKAEVSAVREWIEKLALAHPSVAFQLVSDDRTVLQLKSQTLDERIRALLADGATTPLVHARSENVEVYWLQGASVPQSRKVIQVMNGRVVKDRLLQQAALAPFRQALLPGQYPVLWLSIQIDPALVDVNVHPTKTEVRFAHSSAVFQSVERTISKMIETHGAPAYASRPAFTLARENAAPFLIENHKTAFLPAAHQPSPWLVAEPEPGPTEALGLKTESDTLLAKIDLDQSRFAGSFFQTYLMFERKNEGEPELVLIDQHAAHERIRYESLRQSVLSSTPDQAPAAQELLLPEPVKIRPEQMADLEERIPWLNRLGFATEPFGEDTLLFRCVPAAWGTHALPIRLKNLVERVLETNLSEAPIFDEILFERLASEACHSAVRAGDRLSESEAWAIAEALAQTEHPWNCPHGRPSIVRLTRATLEDWFQRRVAR